MLHMITTSFKTLKTLYTEMDMAWNNIAKGYDFLCNGCEENCCYSLFYHHTYIEKAYLIHGFKMLDKEKKKNVLDVADNFIKNTFMPNFKINTKKTICPINENGRCLLYQYRPMICRLHGLPHELARPGSKPIINPGCNAGLFDDKPYIQFSRTLFYQQMAQIEIQFRQDFNKTSKIKQTIAQMLISP